MRIVWNYWKCAKCGAQHMALREPVACGCGGALVVDEAAQAAAQARAAEGCTGRADGEQVKRNWAALGVRA